MDSFDESEISTYNLSYSSPGSYSDSDVTEGAHYYAAPVVGGEDHSLTQSFVSGANNISVASVPIASMDSAWTPSPIIPPLTNSGDSADTKAKPKVSPDGGHRPAVGDPRVDSRLLSMRTGMLRQLEETQTPTTLPLSLEEALMTPTQSAHTPEQPAVPLIDLTGDSPPLPPPNHAPPMSGEAQVISDKNFAEMMQAQMDLEKVLQH